MKKKTIEKVRRRRRKRRRRKRAREEEDDKKENGKISRGGVRHKSEKQGGGKRNFESGRMSSPSQRM